MIPQYEPSTGKREQSALNEYLKNPGYWTEYKKTEEFEQKIAQYLGVKHCIVVNNGTISLSLALLALGVKPGDNVIVPNFTMIATPNAVKFIGANPILCDIRPNGILDFDQADSLITLYNAKAVIYVSYNGRSFANTDWEYIWKWQQKGIRLLEDAAQSFGSKTYEGSYCGTRGFEIGSFSFSMPKIITTGQGGALVTNDDALAQTLRRLKDFGRSGGGNDKHDFFGINCKFTEMQAVLGLAQLEDIEYRTRRKQQMFSIYKNYLKDVPEVLICPVDGYVVPWFIEILVNDKDKLAFFLKEREIGTRLVYPPINSQEIYKNDSEFIVSKEFSRKGLWLPSSFTLKDKDIEFICNAIKEFYGR